MEVYHVCKDLNKLGENYTQAPSLSKTTSNWVNMSRRRDKPLDIFKRLQVVRSIDDLIYDEDAGTFEKSKAMESDFFKAVSNLIIVY